MREERKATAIILLSELPAAAQTDECLGDETPAVPLAY